MRSILGISAFYHDSAAALIVDGKIISAVQEERFSRKKHDARYPYNAVRFVLKHSNLKLSEIDYIVFCPHVPEEECTCRKPETGLLKRIEEEIGFSLKDCFFIGDKESDIACALRHGCVPILVKTGYGEKTLSSSNCPPAERCFNNLLEATGYVLKN